MYASLPENFSYPRLEQDILAFWKENNTYQLSLDERKGAPAFSFYEGPPTVNGKPGIHHVMARTVKDMICRYKTMRGYLVHRKAGWDTHGLPVEIAVEKALGLTQKHEVDSFGLEQFNAECKNFVYKNIEMDEGWRTLTERMGYWIDLDNPYITCENSYIESVWWAIKTFFDKGLIYKGFRIVPQSPTIETPLSSHELSLGYKDVRDPNCYIKLKITDTKVEAARGAEIIVWTTTPWTLISNVALAVGADVDYAVVKNTRTVKSGDAKIQEVFTLVLAEARLSALDGETEILARCKGRDLLGSRYEQIFPYCHIDTEEYPNALTLLPGDFVSTDDGSGVVHLAPAFGADDFEMSKKFHLPMLQPVTPGGKFTDEAGEFAGRTVKTFTYSDGSVSEGADKDIVIALKKAGKIYRSTNDYLHSYPHCWRTDNPVIYYARDSWFIRTPDYRHRMVELNRGINWQPKEIGTGRFGNWLEEAKEWSLSRDRYWGTPLPIWVAEDGSDLFAVGSIAELSEGIYVRPADGARIPVSELLQELDLHRQFVDHVVFERNGLTYRRVPEIIDVWFDSGAMPFAQHHYPFENKELFDQSFPADFIAEGIDQTRGWFYTLHNISTVLFDKPAFKNIIVNELILDKNGLKMSKSRGNTVDPFTVMDQLGADAVRWYLLVNNPPWKPTLFNADDIANTVIADFFRSLTNVYAFFALYANIDGFKGSEEQIPVAQRPEIDRWILSRLTSVAKEYVHLMDAYEVTKAMRLVQEFAVGDVSNWYVRRNRRRFWKGENDSDKVAAYQTLRSVMMGVAMMTAPTAPFLSEWLWQRLRNDSEAATIHVARIDDLLTSPVDADLENRMRKAQDIVFVARSLREKAKIKTRQPLQRILVPVSSPADRRAVQAVESIITEEVNVKGIEYVSDDTGIVRKSAKPDFKVLGKKFGKQTQGIANTIKTLAPEQVAELEKIGWLNISVEGESFTVEATDVTFVQDDIEGWLVESYNGTTVALDTEITLELRDEGHAREFVNKIQRLRKESGFDVTDRITVTVSCPEELQASIERMQSYICEETLAKSLSFALPETAVKIDVNDFDAYVEVKKSV